MGSHAMLGQMVTFRPCRRRGVRVLWWRHRSAFAQFELVGSWAARNTEDISRDSYPVDYVGLPLNDEGRTRALTYNESQLAMIERQCEGWPQFYFVQGPFGLRIWSDTDPVQGHDDLVHDRRLGRSRADDDLDGWPAAAVEVCRAHARRLHDRHAGKATRSSPARHT